MKKIINFDQEENIMKKIKKLLNTTGTLKLNNSFVVERQLQWFNVLTNEIESCDNLTIQYISPNGPKNNMLHIISERELEKVENEIYKFIEFALEVESTRILNNFKNGKIDNDIEYHDFDKDIKENEEVNEYLNKFEDNIYL